MTPTHRPAARRGFTLIELLVVMAIITALGLLALMLLPGITNSDAVLKGAEEVRATSKVAQAMAAGARQPRGVRFLYPQGAAAGGRHATEMQLLEAPPVTVIDPKALVIPTTAGSNLNAEPYVQFEYTLDPTTRAITRRECKVFHLTADQTAQTKRNGILALPTLGFWSRIAADPNPDASGNIADLQLDFYPDSLMGASTFYRTYHIGVFGPPVPLLGQPTIPLPKNVAIDLDVSAPPAAGGGNYDLMFAPDGQTISVGGNPGNAGVYLWVRDTSKGVNMLSTGAALYDAFRRGGEQHAVGISNGYVGTAPIQWPDTTGTYPAGGPFGLARKRLQ